MSPAAGRILVAVAVAALWVGKPATAGAYVCTQVPSGGPTVEWETRTVPLQFHQRCSLDVPDTAQCLGAMRDAMAAWNDVTCTDFHFQDDGITTETRTGYDWRNPDGNHNIVVFREGTDGPMDGWSHARGALAITTVTFNSQSGRILDTDIEVNGVPFGSAEYRFAICPPAGNCGGANDIQNTMTHELGHALGLDHPPLSDATMFASAPPGETEKRSLHADDTAGVCAIYPLGMPTQPCVPPSSNAPQPHFKQVRSCNDTGMDPCGRPGCSQANGAGLPAALGLVVWALVRRRRSGWVKLLCG